MKDDPLTSSEVQLTRWLDHAPGAVPPENLDPREAARLRADAASVAELLRRHVPTSVEPPYPDFFNSQLLRKIRQEQAHELPQPTARSGGFWSSLAGLLRSPWVAAGATAAVTILAVATLRSPGGVDASTGTRVLSVFSPEPNATARVQATRDQGAVIITLDGLEAFPADRNVVGVLHDDSRPLVASYQP
jgi:hypothetical protein